MSQENIDAVRAAVDAYNRGDIKAAVESCAPDVEWRPAVQTLFGKGETVYRGRRGVWELWEDNSEIFASTRMEVTDIRDLGDRALLLGAFHIRGKKSGADTQTPMAWLVDFRDGLMTRVVTYLTHEDGLEAAGLED